MTCCRSQKNVVRSDQAPKAIGPYSIAVSTGCLVYTSGQLGIDPTSSSLILFLDRA
jgi:2-iminobutanoate/2-iminopropanoate deaminase